MLDAFAAGALLLAVIGLYGVVAFYGDRAHAGDRRSSGARRQPSACTPDGGLGRRPCGAGRTGRRSAAGAVAISRGIRELPVPDTARRSDRAIGGRSGAPVDRPVCAPATSPAWRAPGVDPVAISSCVDRPEGRVLLVSPPALQYQRRLVRVPSRCGGPSCHQLGAARSPAVRRPPLEDDLAGELRVVGLLQELVQLLDARCSDNTSPCRPYRCSVCGRPSAPASARWSRGRGGGRISASARRRTCRSCPVTCPTDVSDTRRRRPASRWLPRCPTVRPSVTCRRPRARSGSRLSSSTRMLPSV